MVGDSFRDDPAPPMADARAPTPKLADDCLWNDWHEVRRSARSENNLGLVRPYYLDIYVK